jgi:hypothetical protein
MALWSTQPLTEMSARYLLGGKGRLARRADKLTAICEPTLWKIWEPRRLTTLRTSTACHSDSSILFTLFICGLFNETVINSTTYDLYRLVVRERIINWQGYGRNRSWPNSKYYPGIVPIINPYPVYSHTPLNTWQSSKLEAVIFVRLTLLHVTILYNE